MWEEVGNEEEEHVIFIDEESVKKKERNLLDPISLF